MEIRGLWGEGRGGQGERGIWCHINYSKKYNINISLFYL